MARRSKGRNISGIFLLDKPAGITSNAALQTVKRIYKAAKAGHTGNLDPLATGLLPLCLGEATKFSAHLLDSDKRYVGTLKLGARTSTSDAEGEVIETRPVPELSREQVESVLQQFSGEIEQIPPMHSALKVNGQPLYKLAHQGLEIERKPRSITIYAIKLLHLAGDELEIDVRCSKGTYIRTLAQDIGEALGCGAHLAALRRSEAGPFRLDEAVSFAEIEHLAEDGFDALDAILLPMDHALLSWPAVNLSDNTAHYVRQGQAVQVARAPSSGWVRLFEGENRFIGIGQILSDGRVAPRRLISGG